MYYYTRILFLFYYYNNISLGIGFLNLGLLYGR